MVVATMAGIEAGNGLMALVPALGAGSGELRGILVEVPLAGGGAEVVGLSVVEGPVLGGRRIDCHSAYGIGGSGFVTHVVSLARWGAFLGRPRVIRTDLNFRLSR